MKPITFYRALLYQYFSEGLTEKEESILAEGCRFFPELIVEKTELQALAAMIRKTRPHPSERFVQQVLERLPKQHKDQAENILLYIERLFTRVAWALGIAFFLALAFTLVREGSITTDTLVGIETLTPEEVISFLQP